MEKYFSGNLVIQKWKNQLEQYSRSNQPKKEDTDRMTAKCFPASFSQFKEGSRQINESKVLEWMDAKVKMKEVDISNDDGPNMERIGDYSNEE